MAHLLVLSGFHFGLAFRLLWQLMLWGWRVVYSLRLLSPGVWFHLRSMTYLLVMLLSGFGLLLVGVSSPGLRAFLLLTITHAIHQFLGLRDKSLRIRLALLVQLVLAPAGLLGLSNIMSWGAYACFVGFEHSAGLGLWRRWQVAIGRQLGLSLLMGLLIGRLSLIGPMANLVLAPWFGLVFYASLLLLIVWEWGSGRAGLQAGIEAYWQAVQWLAECTVVVTAKPWVSPLVAMILTGALLCYGVNQLRCHLRE
jgi:predicted membrane metal-binding protein